MTNKLKEAKESLDKIIKKSRVHLYKHIQIAEILHHHRIYKNIELDQLETYRNKSKLWRDTICNRFVGRSSTSSQKYQDDVFNETAMPPRLLKILGEENSIKGGIVEAYIYRQFALRFTQMNIGLDYCKNNDENSFELDKFLALFWNEPGLKRSIDKVYEIIVYSLFSSLVDALDISVQVSLNPSKGDLLKEFEDFTEKVIQLNSANPSIKIPAKIFRVGVTNAADRGLDMWANFGLAIQIKHLSLTEELTENIVSSVMADRIVIVCKELEKNLIVSLLNQIGWKSRIQSIITEQDLLVWYKKALTGKHSTLVGKKVLSNLIDQINVEFQSTNNQDFSNFIKDRNYEILTDTYWTI